MATRTRREMHRGWFGVRCDFKMVVDEERLVYEERVTVWRAVDAAEAIRLAEAEALEYAKRHRRRLPPSYVLIFVGTRLSHGVDVGEFECAVPADGDEVGPIDGGRLAAVLGAPASPVDWCRVGSGVAGQRWSELREWVVWFRREFGFDHRVVPPCWYRHLALVSVLSAVRDAWLGAYDPLNSPAGPADWHQRLLVLEPRLREWASRTGCTLGAHRPDVVTAYPDGEQAWKTHVATDVAARRAREIRTAQRDGAEFEQFVIDGGGDDD